MDQAMFTGQRAAGQELLIQCVWVYEHAIDLDGLRRFHRNLGYGLLGRRIERSALPFARYRWVVDRGPADIDIAESARPRTELSDWADERSQLPIDAESGPGWHLGVLPLTDGSTAVSLVLSHFLIDGLGLAVVLADAVLGNMTDLGYPPPLARTRLRAVAQDARQAARDVPQLGRALVTGAKLARRARRDRAQSPAKSPASAPPSSPAALPVGDSDDVVVIPAVTIYVDLDQWDARAKALGGTSNTLAAAVGAKLGDHMGRRRGDGAITLQLPISNRTAGTEGDTRAIALSYVRATVDPTRLTTDLSDARAAIKQALRTQGETPDESSQLLWLVPYTPKRALKRTIAAGLADPDLPVVCSNLGDLGLVLCRIDGTDAEYAFARGGGQHIARQWLERMGGQLRLQFWRIGGKMGVSVVAYQPGAENTKPALRELAARALAEFGLTGQIE